MIRTLKAAFNAIRAKRSNAGSKSLQALCFPIASPSLRSYPKFTDFNQPQSPIDTAYITALLRSSDR